MKNNVFGKGQCHVKPPTKTPKPKIAPAPQSTKKNYLSFAKDTYCGFHTCVWAHNLGFNISTNYCYDPKYDVEHLYIYSVEYSCSTKERMDRMITAMTQTTLMGWLQETFNVHVEIYCNAMGWGWLLTKLNGTTLLEIEDDMFFDSYKEALEVGLTKAMDIITLNGGKNLMLIPASQIHR